MKMYLISDNIDTQTGMRLAGVDGVVVHERDELRNALETVLADKEIGILLLTEKFGREFPEIIDDVRLHHKVPLIVEIPDRHGTGTDTGHTCYESSTQIPHTCGKTCGGISSSLHALCSCKHSNGAYQ